MNDVINIEMSLGKKNVPYYWCEGVEASLWNSPWHSTWPPHISDASIQDPGIPGTERTILWFQGQWQRQQKQNQYLFISYLDTTLSTLGNLRGLSEAGLLLKGFKLTQPTCDPGGATACDILGHMLFAQRGAQPCPPTPQVHEQCRLGVWARAQVAPLVKVLPIAEILRWRHSCQGSSGLEFQF